ncbi:hypothetical protein EJ110_NYTH40065 [Nymphaea thermarum]|nr:hypothetical protein EJ110_NYTH40065 [Nymphaea thermarum]
MSENPKLDSSHEFKIGGNPFSYGSTVKLDGLNYEIWSTSFMMSVTGHRKKYLLEEDEPVIKTGKYALWEEDNSMVMSWIMNSVDSSISPTIAYYTTAKEMWDFLRETYSHDKNMSKVFQVEEELYKLQQGDMSLPQYFAVVKATFERLKSLRPPCKSCYKTHYEQSMVSKFLVGLSPEYSVAKAQMLTGSDIPGLAEAYNRLSRLAVTLPPSVSDTPTSALAASNGRGSSSSSVSRGRGTGRGFGGRGRFQCTHCGKIGHLVDRCWDIYGRPSGGSQGRGSKTPTGRGTSSSVPTGMAQATAIGENPSTSESFSLSLNKAEYEHILSQRAVSSSTSVSASSGIVGSALSTVSHDPGSGGKEKDGGLEMGPNGERRERGTCATVAHYRHRNHQIKMVGFNELLLNVGLKLLLVGHELQP